MEKVKKLYKIKIRKKWGINPKARVKESAKRYFRAKSKKELKKALEELEKEVKK